MASISHFYYSDDSFSSPEFSQFPYHQLTAAAASGEITNCYGEYTGTVSSGAVPIWGNTEENFPMVSCDNVLAPDQSDAVSHSPMMMPFPADQLGIWDSVVPTLAEYNNMAISDGIQNFGASRFQQPPADVCEYGDDYCCTYNHDLKPIHASTGENWGIQNNQMSSMEDGNVIKVGRYSVEERKDRILRYLKKKNQRNFNKTIKYACRKTLAERRVRVRGRFARNNEMCDEEVGMKNNDNNSHKDKNLYCELDDVQIKLQDEEWLQEAMASLLYVPFIAGS